MIDLILQAERALAVGLVAQAERLYRQALDADPRNSIAVVGLARVALEQGDDASAFRLGRKALEIDPENAAAMRLVSRLTEVFAARGERIPSAEAESDPQAPDGAEAGGPARGEVNRDDAAGRVPGASGGERPRRDDARPQRRKRGLLARVLGRKSP